MDGRKRKSDSRRRPGEIRDAIVAVLAASPQGASIPEIEAGVHARVGVAPSSSVRSYLRLNSETLFRRTERGVYSLRDEALPAARNGTSRNEREFLERRIGKATLVLADCLEWLDAQPERSIHAVVTDPPYGILEYSNEQQAKLRSGKGGVWRIPPAFDGFQRSPLPRFTVLKADDLRFLETFFLEWGRRLLPVLVPGANVVVASNPLLSHLVSNALARAGLERRGELVRLVMTMRGGDRPKAAHEEFANVSVMPRSMWEPWLLYRKPLEGRAQDNLRKWGTGGFRRPSADRPFGDVITSSPTRRTERSIAAHPSLKPQEFLRKVVRGVLPLGKGKVLDPFAGSGSTLAAADFLGYESIGIEKDRTYFDLASKAIPKLAALEPSYSFSL